MSSITEKLKATSVHGKPVGKLDDARGGAAVVKAKPFTKQLPRAKARRSGLKTYRSQMDTNSDRGQT